MIKCMTCGIEVPPIWIHAISTNTCPNHGGPIFDDSAKELLDELTKAMEEMPNNPAGLAGWLLSNYHLTKIGDAQPVEFYGTKQVSPGISKRVNSSENNKFLKRAGVDQHRLENIVKQINKSQEEMYGKDDDNVFEDESQEQVVPKTPEEIAFMQNAMPFAGLNKGNMLLQNGGSISSGELGAFHALAEEAAEKLSNIPPALERERMKRLAQQEARVANLSGKNKPIKRVE